MGRSKYESIDPSVQKEIDRLEAEIKRLKEENRRPVLIPEQDLKKLSQRSGYTIRDLEQRITWLGKMAATGMKRGSHQKMKTIHELTDLEYKVAQDCSKKIVEILISAKQHESFVSELDEWRKQ